MTEINRGFQTVEVPFVQIGNRRGFTAQQLVEHKWLAGFVKKFASSFEQPGLADYVLFIEPQNG